MTLHLRTYEDRGAPELSAELCEMLAAPGLEAVARWARFELAQACGDPGFQLDRFEEAIWNAIDGMQRRAA